MTTAKQEQKAETRADIFAAAILCAKTHGLYSMTRSQIARKAKTGNGTVTFHYGEMVELRREVVRHCIAHPTVANLKILAQALAQRDTIAVRAPADVKRAALNTLA